jgi:hypothetical protein
MRSIKVRYWIRGEKATDKGFDEIKAHFLTCVGKNKNRHKAARCQIEPEVIF